MRNINNIKYRDAMDGFVSLLDMIYPIHSLYWSYADVSPSDLFGGTWVKIENAIVAISGKDYGEVRECIGDWKITINHLPEKSKVMSSNIYSTETDATSGWYFSTNTATNTGTDTPRGWHIYSSNEVNPAGFIGGGCHSIPIMYVSMCGKELANHFFGGDLVC